MPDFIIVAIAIIGNLIIGLFTFIKNYKSATNVLFFLLSISISLYLFLNDYAIRQPTASGALMGMNLTILDTLFINLFFLLLTVVFPGKKFYMKPFRFWLVMLFTFIMMPLILLNLVFKSATAYAQNGTPGPAIPLFLLQTVIFLGLGFFILIRKFIKSKGRERNQLRLFFAGTAIMFASILFTNVFLYLVFKIGNLTNLLPLYTLIFVSFIGYAIIKHGFLDISLLVARSVAYILVLTLLGGIYSLLTFFIGSKLLHQNLSFDQIIVFGLFAFIIAFTFQPLRRSLEELTDKIFYRGYYDVDKFLKSLSEIMSSNIILDTLSTKILDRLLQVMHITKGALILLEKENNKNIDYIEKIGFNEGIKFDDEKIKQLLLLKKILIIDDMEEGEIKQIMREYNISIVLPLIANEKDLGVLVLGEKEAGNIYSERELGLFSILYRQLSLAIQNAKEFDEISKFNVTLKEEVARATKQLKDLTEQQKDQVDIMGHEVKTPLTAISQQLNLLLEMVLTEEKREEWLKGNVQPEDAKRTIEGLKKMQAAEMQEESIVTNMIEAARLDKMRFELNYSPFDLIELVTLAIKDSENRLETNKQIGHIVLRSELDKLDVEADKTRIKQCIDGLLTNAEKYGRNPQTHALDVTVSVITDSQMTSISVRDQGMGIDSQDMEKLGKKFSRLNSHADGSKLTRPGGSGLGLYTYKGIIENHKGQLIIESEGTGRGSTFTLKFPQKRPQESSILS